MRNGDTLSLGVGRPAQGDPGGSAPGTCYGFAVRSELSLSALRSAGEGAPLTVTPSGPDDRLPTGPPYIEWRDDADSVYARLYRVDGGHAVWVNAAGWFWIYPRRSTIAVSETTANPRWEARLWGLPAALMVMCRGDLVLHGAAIDVGGQAIILAAPGKYGKTTLATAFLRAGHRLLAEDTTCFRLDPTPVVLPGPALLRVRPDVFARLEVPGGRVLAEDPDRVYLSLAEAARGSGSGVPICGVVLLRRGDGATRIDSVEPMDSLPDLWTLSFKLPEDEDRARCLRGVTGLAASVPIWNLNRRLSFQGLPKLVDAIVATCAP